MLNKTIIVITTFFTRKIIPEKRPIEMQEDQLIAPADSKLTYYPIREDTHLLIKDSLYSLSDLLQDETLAKEYHGGDCLIFRLTVDDYHRYCFIDDGDLEGEHYIPGKFHTVNPIANDYYPIYKQNARSYSLLHTKNFGDVIYMEVGAMMVGKIVNHPIKSFKKGEEKVILNLVVQQLLCYLKKALFNLTKILLKILRLIMKQEF